MMIIVESAAEDRGEHWQQLCQGSARTDDQILIYMERSGNCRSILFATQRSPFLGRFAAQRVIG
jgi:hypothetical protein